MNIIKEWLNTPYIGVMVGVGATILGTAITLAKFKRPLYFNEFNSIISNLKSKYGKIEVRYEDTIIENLSETKLYFWNAGRKSIRGGALRNILCKKDFFTVVNLTIINCFVPQSTIRVCP